MAISPANINFSQNFSSGQLVAVVANRDTAWPYIPGTQDRVVGTIKYFWERNGNDKVWRPVPGGTGDAITYENDGNAYRVTVTFDLTGYVPAGYTADPIMTSATAVYGSTQEPTQICPDGSILPVSATCPEVIDNCIAPSYLNTSSSPFWINDQGVKTQKITVGNDDKVALRINVKFSGFSNTGFVYEKAEATIFTGGVTPGSAGGVNRTITLQPSSNPNLKNSDVISFTGGIRENHPNTTKNYNVTFKIYYKCLGEDTTFTSYGLFNYITATWGLPDKPYVYSGPECRYAPAYQNSSGCGSYVADWLDPVQGKLETYYMLKQGSTNIDDRGPKFSSAISEQNARCDFCPDTTCPTLNIKNVTLNPRNPGVGDLVTAQVVFDWDPKGFGESANPTIVQWTGDGVQCQPGQVNCLQQGVQVFLGPYTSKGLKDVNVRVTQFFEDPGKQCSLDAAGVFSGFTLDTYDFTINIGGINEPPDDPVGEEPVMTGTIEGDSTLTLSNGTVTGNYKIGYDLYEGQGYRISGRPITVKWEELKAEFDKYDYSRTFTTAGTYTVSARIAKLFAKPGWEGSVAGANTIPDEYKKYAYDDVNFNVKVEPEPSNDGTPSATASITGPNKGTLNNGTVTLDFSATASVGNTNYTPTSEASRFTYGRNNAFKNNATNVSWSETFTSAGTYDIPVTFRKNYCDPGVSFDSSTGSCDSGSKSSAVGRATKTVTIEAGGPSGTKPKASISQTITYSSEVDQCGYGIVGIPASASATATINMTQGTGDYVYDDFSAPGWVKNGNTLQKSVSKSSSIEQKLEGTFASVNVTFTKGGKTIHTEASGEASWCINFKTFNIGPINPNL